MSRPAAGPSQTKLGKLLLLEQRGKKGNGGYYCCCSKWLVCDTDWLAVMDSGSHADDTRSSKIISGNGMCGKKTTREEKRVATFFSITIFASISACDIAMAL